MIYLTQSRNLLQSELRKRGIALCRNLASVSKDGILTEDLFKSLSPVVRSFMSEPDVVYVIIMNKESKVLAHTELGEVGKVYKDELTKKAFSSKEPKITAYSKEKKELYDVGMFVKEEEIFLKARELDEETPFEKTQEKIIGAVRIGISLEKLNTEIEKISKFGIGLTIIAITIGFAFSFIFSRSFVKPISLLVKATKKIASGDFLTKTEIKTKDEIGILATSFNEMTEKLKNSFNEIQRKKDELQHLTEQLQATNEQLTTANEELKRMTKELEEAKTQLEEKVKERTAELEKERASLEIKVKERTKELEEAKALLEEKVRERTLELEKSRDELQRKVRELEKFTEIALGREVRIAELKEEIEKLKKELAKNRKING